MSASAGHTRRMPRGAAAPAALPPAGLPGLEDGLSRLVRVDPAGDGGHEWHILDNAERLAAAGVTPVGTILCVHGNPTWSYLWRALVAAAPDWRVIAVDQLEMGFSERTGVPRPLPLRVRDLGELTDALGIDGPVVTLGHDWGGVVSLGWAVDHPELLAGVMLLNTAVHQPEESPIPAPLRLALSRGVLAAATVTTPAFLDTTLALGHPGLSAEVKDAYRAPYRGAARRAGIGGFVADIPVATNHPSRPELDRIADGVAQLDVPALMLWGPRDPIFSDRYLDDLATRLPHADIHRFEGAGHLIAEDIDYVSRVLDWLGERIAPDAVADTSADNAADRGAAAEAATVPDGEALADSDSDSEATASAPAAAAAEPQEKPLWHQLDALSGSAETALIDMVAGANKTPRVVSWTLLSRRVDEIARGLTAAGVAPGDRVSLLVPPSAELTAVLYACLRIGAVVVVADAGLGVAGLSRAVRGARPKHIIGARPGLTIARALGWPGQRISVRSLPAPEALALGVTHSLAGIIALGRTTALPPEPGADALAAVLFTSGSTGPAKGVLYTHRQLTAMRDALSAQYGVGVGTGLVAGFAPFALLGPALGARSVTPDMDVTAPRTLTARAVAAAAQAAEATVVFLSPAALTNVVATSGALTAADHAALGRVRTFLSAGAPVPEPLLAAAGRLMPGAVPHTPYGMTEGLLLTDITLDGIRAAAADGGQGGACVGQATANATVRIDPLGDDGMPIGEPGANADVTGEIVVSAPHLRDGYDRLWEITRNASSTEDGARWHHTGDVGHLDSEGRLWVEGRLPHVIVTASGVITPVGIEQRVETIDSVARAAAVGVGPRGAQRLVVVVEPTSPGRRVRLADADLAAAVRAAVAPQDVSAVIVSPTLPTDIRHNSKIDRAALSRWADGILRGGRMVAP